MNKNNDNILLNNIIESLSDYIEKDIKDINNKNSKDIIRKKVFFLNIIIY